MFFVWLIAVLSANLAVVNALPFPPMDGGRIAMSLLKRVTGQPDHARARAERVPGGVRGI